MELQAKHENCSGCGACRLACAMENQRQVNPALAVLRIDSRFPIPGDYRIRLCDQCGRCAEVCPVEAITMDERGVYIIDPDECTGCLQCLDECPHGVITDNRAASAPFKCTLCGVCAEVCPRDAIVMVG